MKIYGNNIDQMLSGKLSESIFIGFRKSALAFIQKTSYSMLNIKGMAMLFKKIDSEIVMLKNAND